jgi:hypothetical protein
MKARLSFVRVAVNLADEAWHIGSITLTRPSANLPLS